MPRFVELQKRLVDHLRRQVRSGAWTERGLSRATGISQPHIHNVLKGKKEFSLEMSDVVLRAMNLDIVDLLDPGETRRLRGR
jgi:hypothetical protein